MERAHLEQEIDHLYGLPPAEFTAARNDLVRRLRKEGDRALVAEVGALRRPTAAAWAVNQLVRRRRADVERLVGLGAALREAQEGAISGADAETLRRAARARRDAVAAMADAAAAILAEAGSGVDAHRDAIAATLEAATIDAAAGALVVGGRLSSELRPVAGFGPEAGDLGVGRPLGGERATGGTSRVAGEEPAGDEERRRQREERERLVAETRRRAEELAEMAVAAAGRADAARREAARAAERVAALESALVAARQEAVTATAEAAEARRQAAAAHDAAAGAGRALARAEADPTAG